MCLLTSLQTPVYTSVCLSQRLFRPWITPSLSHSIIISHSTLPNIYCFLIVSIVVCMRNNDYYSFLCGFEYRYCVREQQKKSVCVCMCVCVWGHTMYVLNTLYGNRMSLCEKSLCISVWKYNVCLCGRDQMRLWRIIMVYVGKWEYLIMLCASIMY